MLHQSLEAKFFDWPGLKETVRDWKAQGLKVVFTNGCFDLLHPGHVDYLSRTAALGDKLVLGLNSDASVKRLKGEKRPIQAQNSRAAVLAGLSSISAITIFDQDTPLELIEAITPDVLAKGGDYTPETVVGASHVIDNGGEVAIIPFLEGHSTSAIERHILAGYRAG